MSDAPAADTGPVVTRFAPSPTGLLHLGHAHSALFAQARARRAGGSFRLRIEDIDTVRCKDGFVDAIFDDLTWLGLAWDPPVPRQRERADVHAEALTALDAMGLVYPCFCTRKEIRAEIQNAAAAPHGTRGQAYPGTCRSLSATERAERHADGRPYALRLDVAAAHERVGFPAWHDRRAGTATADLRPGGDIIIGRKDIGTSYHLAVTLDDAAQGITLVTRGADLMESTPIHRVLQALLDLPVPAWEHHDLLTDAEGRRLAKRDRSRGIRHLREQGHTPAEVRAMAGFPDAPGVPDDKS
jgi:glutamyl-Q tRNA(Asp) synthetase